MAERQLVKASRGQMDLLLSKPDVRRQIMAAVPKHMDVDRLCRQAITLLSTNPALTDCNDVSVLAGIIRAGELGLELSGPLGHAYLVPRYNKKAGSMEACFQLGYKGIINLAFRSDKLRAFHMRTVCENDTFLVRYGTDPVIDHAHAEGDRGQPSHFYAAVFFRNGGHDFEVMTVAEARDWRQRFALKNPMWDNHFEAMAQKTCAHKLGKRCPTAVELQSALAEDEENGFAAQDVAALPTAAGPRKTRTEQLLADYSAEPDPADTAGLPEAPE